MADNKYGKGLMEGAMRAGTAMGVFWIIKFVFFPLGLGNMFFMVLFVVLTCYVPFLGYKLTKFYRDNYRGGLLSFGQAWGFGIWMYLFASMLTAVAHFVYFRFIDNGRVLQYYQDAVDNIARQDATSGLGDLVQQMQFTLDVFYQFSATDLMWQLLTQNLFYGSVLALITAPFVMRRKKYGDGKLPDNNTPDNSGQPHADEQTAEGNAAPNQ